MEVVMQHGTGGGWGGTEGERAVRFERSLGVNAERRAGLCREAERGSR